MDLSETVWKGSKFSRRVQPPPNKTGDWGMTLMEERSLRRPILETS